MATIDEMITASGIRGRLKAAANGCHPLKTDRGDYGLLDDALDEINRLRSALEDIAISADDGDGWTSDGHERCTEAAQQAIKSNGGQT
ncbi:MAG: hypothetical protein WA790_19360 [Sulfitobacter sp.]